ALALHAPLHDALAADGQRLQRPGAAPPRTAVPALDRLPGRRQPEGAGGPGCGVRGPASRGLRSFRVEARAGPLCRFRAAAGAAARRTGRTRLRPAGHEESAMSSNRIQLAGLLFVVAGASGLAGCGSSSPAAPETPPPLSTAKGTVVTQVADE